MIKKSIFSLLQELDNYHRSRDKIIYEAISIRLNKSLKSYADDLDYSLQYLSNRKPEKIMRKLNK